jgi:protein-disulfide isomerase
MTIENLIFDDSKPFHLKILEVLPSEAIIQIGSDDAENTIIEFMDYFCFYCKKLQPELVELVNERDDVRVIFLQYPILSESSKVIAKMAIAANYQQKGFEFHHAIFSISGSLNQKKLTQAIKSSGINSIKLKIDSSKDEMEKIILLSSFIAGGIGARGTPSLFVNENFSPGYISKEQIIKMLK